MSCIWESAISGRSDSRKLYISMRNPLQMASGLWGLQAFSTITLRYDGLSFCDGVKEAYPKVKQMLRACACVCVWYVSVCMHACMCMQVFLCLCVHVCVCVVCKCMYACMHVYAGISVFVCTCVCVWYVSVCMHACMCMQVFLCLCVHVCVCVWYVSVCMHACMCMQVFLCLCIHVCTCVYMCVRVGGSEDNFAESVSSFYPNICSGNWTQVSRFARKELSPLSHPLAQMLWLIRTAVLKL